MRGDVVEDHALVIDRAADDVPRLAGIELGLVGHQLLAIVQIPGVVHVVMLATGEGTPGDQALDVDAPGRVGPTIIDHTGPAGADQVAPDLTGQVEVVHADAAHTLGQAS